jgi:uncharacterized protein YbjT (DUF2867 family)
MYVITGATGHTGSVAAERLLAAGAKVRVVGRDAARLKAFAAKGAEAVVADMTDPAALEKALSGARAVYAVVPPNIGAPDVRVYQEQVTDSLARAIRGSGAAYAVVLSSTGADKASGTGPVVGLHNLEKKLEAIDGLNVLSLRCGHFMENLLNQIGVIQSMGFMAGAVRADVPLPMIATADIGAVAADSLEKLDFTGKETRELLGPRHVSNAEAAKIIGEAIGKPGLSYKQFPGMLLKPAMKQLGLSASMADLILEMSEALNTGHMKSQQPRSPRNTTPTTLEQFAAEVFAPAYRGKAAGAQ